MVVISLGGSIVAPEKPDVDYLTRLRTLLEEHLRVHGEERLILVVGGGGPARFYQAAYRELAGNDSAHPDALDWIGVMATRLNAELIRHAMGALCRDPVVTDPTAEFAFTGRILVAAGWKPGFSTDFDAVVLAERYGAEMVINLSNVERVYTADPRTNEDAAPLDAVSWSDFRGLVGSAWNPGSNLPFDPVASERAESLRLTVIAAAGRDLDNVARILEGGAFVGTRIGPG